MACEARPSAPLPRRSSCSAGTAAATPQRPSTPCSASARACDPPTTATSSDNTSEAGRPGREPPPAQAIRLNRSRHTTARGLTALRNRFLNDPKRPDIGPARSPKRAGNVTARSTSGVIRNRNGSRSQNGFDAEHASSHLTPSAVGPARSLVVSLCLSKTARATPEDVGADVAGSLHSNHWYAGLSTRVVPGLESELGRAMGERTSVLRAPFLKLARRGASPYSCGPEGQAGGGPLRRWRRAGISQIRVRTTDDGMARAHLDDGRLCSTCALERCRIVLRAGDVFAPFPRVCRFLSGRRAVTNIRR